MTARATLRALGRKALELAPIGRLTFSGKLLLMPVVAGAGFVVVIAISQLAAARYAELNVRIERGYAPALAFSHDLESLFARVQRGLQDAVGASDADLLADADGLRDAVLERMRQAAGNPVLEPGELAALERRFRNYYVLARDTSARMIHGETGERLAAALEHMRVEYNGIRDDLGAFDQRRKLAMARAFTAARVSHQRAMAAITGITLLCVLLLGAISLLAIRSLQVQLGEAAELAEGVTRGEAREVRATSGDEIGSLLRSMDTMARRVGEREEALRASEERYALAARGANDGLWDWDLLADKVYYSIRWKSMLGYQEGEIGDTPQAWLERVHADDRAALETSLAEHLGGRTQHFESEHRVRARDGAYRWVLTRGIALRDAGGKAYRMAGSQSDITERKRAEEQLLRNAFVDPLTELPNRALFLDRLRTALRRAGRSRDHLVAVVFLDVDRFKLVNDGLGHLAGDELLKALAQRLQACLRPGDTVARFGGDEFTLLLDDVGTAERSTRIAERIRSELALPFRLAGQEVFVTASMGIALGGTGALKAEDLLRDADSAMNRAKAAGRARHEIFHTAMRQRAVGLLRLESDLRRAIEREEFRVHYQPIVALESGRLAGFEALVRWQHPERGLVPPAEFVPLAEETGLIVPIGEWVLWRACRQMRTWAAGAGGRSPVSVSANLSARQFAQPDLAALVGRVSTEAGGSIEHLHLEVTESAVMENGELAAATLRRLKDMGIRISVDDFGTGYSSLSYLRQLPIDTLKVDQSFVARMGNSSAESEIVRTIVSLAHQLGLTVVAEGVESQRVWDELRGLGCEYGQGFLFSEPVDETVASRMLEVGSWRPAS